MKSLGTIERVDLLASCVGLFAALLLTLAAVGPFFGATSMSTLCLWIERAGVVLALLGGAVHNVVLWRRFGIFNLWLSFKQLYGDCPRRVRLFSFAIGLVGAVSFAVLIAARDSVTGPASSAHTALIFASFLFVWFSLVFAQVSSLIYGANQSLHRTCAKSRAGR
ncbi:hypothetical protein J5J83_19080 [Azoarcus sp. L1K30]|uniref:hypothetical protein n=1 Tax=Azoarcus sp. L1K30 TaxID=2820277 RepID=UPI001B844978|nr:hypothetical protein [Azoarcus sp. L1K30]MBR0568230.1 hypothetical protein [Azoarcus sp. L1K30]